MKEDFLHYVWKFQKFSSPKLFSHSGEAIHVIHPGQYNNNSGPDFLTAQLTIGNQKWAGHVEIHVQSSHWFAHQHQQDPNYDNVILHVVWKHDATVYRANGLEIPVLELCDRVDFHLVDRYQKLVEHKQIFIPCENELPKVLDLVFEQWITRMYVERLEEQSKDIKLLLQETQYNWEAVLLKCLARSFGVKVNSIAFESMICSLPFSVIQKCSSDTFILEALFLGQSGLLNDSFKDLYFVELKKTYRFISKKFQLDTTGVVTPQYFRLRPSSFPTIRLSQFAQLWSSQKHLLSKLVESKTVSDWYKILSASATSYWDTHYRFGVPSTLRKKQITKNLQNLLIINCILPITYTYTKYHGDTSYEAIVDKILQIPSEKNHIIEGFKKIRFLKNSALYSQGAIHLKNNYCNHKKCLQCQIGNHILKY